MLAVFVLSMGCGPVAPQGAGGGAGGGGEPSGAGGGGEPAVVVPRTAWVEAPKVAGWVVTSVIVDGINLPIIYRDEPGCPRAATLPPRSSGSQTKLSYTTTTINQGINGQTQQSVTSQISDGMFKAGCNKVFVWRCGDQQGCLGVSP